MIFYLHFCTFGNGVFKYFYLHGEKRIYWIIFLYIKLTSIKYPIKLPLYLFRFKLDQR